MQNSFWSRFFLGAALFNFVVGLPLLWAPLTMFGLLGQTAPNDLFFVRTSGLLIASFGLGYYFVSRAPQANRNIVWLGVIGKFGVVVLSGLYWTAGLMPTTSAVLSLGDLAFVFAFLRFLTAG